MPPSTALRPKLLTTLRGYTRAQFIADAGAGLVVGIVALPLAIAFAIASGLTPERGLWTAIVAGFLISALGGSRVQIGGPTGAFVPIVAGVLAQYGGDGLLVATLLAGVFLVVAGLAGAGTLIKYVPHPVITGFTSGIAILIACTQLRDLLGLSLRTLPVGVLEQLHAYATHLGTIGWPTVALSAASLALLVWWPRVSRRVPGPFVVVVIAAVATHVLQLPVETIGSRFGALPAGLPTVAVPSLSLAELRGLVAPAFTIALLGGIESLLSAVVADGMIGGRHRPNMELVAQGIANIAAPLVGGLPATGAMARTATNVRNGGRTPVAGIVHAVVLLGITLSLSPLVAHIPMAALAAILLVVAYHMSEWRVFVAELRAPKADVAVLLVTFTLTVLVDLTVALQAGMLLAAALFVKQMGEVAGAERRGTTRDGDEGTLLPHRPLPAGVVLYDLSGPMFFGAADRFREALGQVAGRPKALVLQMRDVPTLDATGLKLLADVGRRCRRDGTLLLLSEVAAQPREALRRQDTADWLEPDALVPTLEEAVARASLLVTSERAAEGRAAEPGG